MGIMVLGICRYGKERTMAKKPLNAEEIAELRSCPYVASIISGRVNFTPEFKRSAYQQLMDGKTMRTLFEEHGIDLEILSGAFHISSGLMQTAKKAMLIFARTTAESRQKKPGNRLWQHASNSSSTNWHIPGRRWNS